MIDTAGIDTQERFRVQAGLAALYSLSMLDEGSDIAAVLIEVYDDFSLAHTDGSQTYCQVKTRQIERGSFSFNSEEIMIALARFVVRKQVADHEVREFLLITNIGFGTDRTGQTKLERFLRDCGDEDLGGNTEWRSPASRILAIANKILSNNGRPAVELGEVRAVMSVVSARAERFNLDFLERIVELGVRAHPAADEISRDATAGLARDLIAMMFDRAAKAGEEHIPGSIRPGINFRDETERRKLAARQVSKQALQAVFDSCSRLYPRRGGEKDVFAFNIDADCEILEANLDLSRKIEAMLERIADGDNPKCLFSFQTSAEGHEEKDAFEQYDEAARIRRLEREIGYGVKILLVERARRMMLYPDGSLERCEAVRRYVRYMNPSNPNAAHVSPEAPYEMVISRRQGNDHIPFSMLAVSPDIILSTEAYQAQFEQVHLGGEVGPLRTVDEIVEEPNPLIYVSDLPWDFRAKAVLPRLIWSIVQSTDPADYDKFGIDRSKLDFAGFSVRFQYNGETRRERFFAAHDD